MQCHEVVRLLLRLRTGSAGFLEDKKRCKMIIDERRAMCGSGCGGFMVVCGEFRRDR